MGNDYFHSNDATKKKQWEQITASWNATTQTVVK